MAIIGALASRLQFQRLFTWVTCHAALNEICYELLILDLASIDHIWWDHLLNIVGILYLMICMRLALLIDTFLLRFSCIWSIDTCIAFKLLNLLKFICRFCSIGFNVKKRRVIWSIKWLWLAFKLFLQILTHMCLWGISLLILGRTLLLYLQFCFLDLFL